MLRFVSSDFILPQIRCSPLFGNLVYTGTLYTEYVSDGHAYSRLKWPNSLQIHLHNGLIQSQSDSWPESGPVLEIFQGKTISLNQCCRNIYYCTDRILSFFKEFQTIYLSLWIPFNTKLLFFIWHSLKAVSAAILLYLEDANSSTEAWIRMPSY